jgi:hypothetical protein
MFLCVYLSCTAAATRILTGPARVAAAVAVLAVLAVLAFCGWQALLAVAVVTAVAGYRGRRVSTCSLTRADPVSTQMADPAAAALIRSGVCATGYAVRVPGTTTVSREPVIHRRPAASMTRAGADMALGA